MADSLETIGTFSRVRWPEGAHADENSHWIGKMVEWYFDYGQTSYNVTHKSCEDGVFVEKHNANRGLGRTILKVIGCALKALSLLTVVIPLAMLIGKVIYRTNNKFVFKPEAPKSHGDTPVTPGENSDPTTPGSNGVTPTGTITETTAPKRVLSQGEREFLLSEVLSEEKLDQRIAEYDEKADDIYVDCFGDLEKVRILNGQVNDQITRIERVIDKGEGLDQNTIERLRKALDDFEAIKDKLKLSLKDDPRIKEIVKELERRATENPSDENKVNYYKAVETLKELSKITEGSEPFDVSFYDEVKASIMPTPIRNCGNSCYLNSDLQLILSIPGIKELLLGDFKQIPVREKEDWETQEEYQDTVEKEHKNFELTKEYLKEVKPAFQAFVEAVESKDQNRINDAARELRNATYDVGRKNVEKGKKPLFKMIEDGPLGRHEQMQPETFINTMLNAVGYSLRTRRYGFGDDECKVELKACRVVNSETMILLPLKHDVHDEEPIARTMQGLIDHQFAPISMNEGDWVVEDKSVKKDVTLLQEAPEYLFVQVMRFGTDWETMQEVKLDDSIIFDDGEQVDFSKAMAKTVQDEDGGPFLYEVLGAVQHHGDGSSGGHYTSMVKKAGEWNHCDDEKPVDGSFGKSYPVKEGRNRPNLEKGYIFAFKRVPKGTVLIG